MIAPIVLALRVLLAASLYAFLFWALWTIWRDLRSRGTFLATRKIPGINLVTQAADLPPQPRFFSQAEILIGRDLHCDVSLQDETVSIRHARLAYHHGQWWLEDLGSTNGTRLNKELLTTPTVIINGDQVECGQTLITLNLGVDPASPSTQRIESTGEPE
jgi:pSer/pThr/pTyr-binding forkhead associated (FHA) protein